MFFLIALTRRLALIIKRAAIVRVQKCIEPVPYKIFRTKLRQAQQNAKFEFRVIADSLRKPLGTVSRYSLCEKSQFLLGCFEQKLVSFFGFF